MPYLIGIGIAVLIFILIYHGNHSYGKSLRQWRYGLGVAVGIAVICALVLTGRAHVLTAIFAGLIPVFKQLPTLLKMAPQFKASSTGEDGPGRAPRTANLTPEQAREILGVKEGCTENEIIEAHRRLMQKLHPDRGGNDYLAAQVNQARDCLLRKA